MTTPGAPEPSSGVETEEGVEPEAGVSGVSGVSGVEPEAGVETMLPDGATPVDPPTAPRDPRVTQGEAPTYKGEPLDAERGPGLGCFWAQMILLGTLLVLTPLSVVWAWPEWLSAAMLVITLVLLLFAGQTVIFLMRLVAADRRTRRVPRSPAARRTVGMLEDEAGVPVADASPEADPPATDDTPTDPTRSDPPIG